MIRRFFKSKPSLSISLLLHGLILLVMVFLLLMKSCQSIDQVHVFELSDIPEKAPKVAPNKLNAATPKLTPSNQAQQDYTKPKVIDYETFLKKNPKKIPKKENLKKSLVPKVEPLPRFTTESSDEHQYLKPPESNQAQNQKVLEAYAQYVYRTLNSYWDKPRSQLASNTQIKVQFTLLGSGAIQSFKIINSSGSASFDNSIKAIFDSIGAFKPTPIGKKQTFTMVFRLDS